MNELNTTPELILMGGRNDELHEFLHRQPEDEGETGRTERDWAAMENEENPKQLCCLILFRESVDVVTGFPIHTSK